MIIELQYLLILAAIAAVCLWFGRGPRDDDKDGGEKDR